MGLWLCREAFAGRAWADRARLLAVAPLRRMLAVNTDIMIRSVLLQGCFTTFLFLGAGFGDVTLAANQVLLQFLEITAYALDGFAIAAETLVGQAVGARRRAQVRRASLVTLQWAVPGSLGRGALFWFGGPAIIDLMATAPGVRSEARAHLPWLAIDPLIAVASYMFDGIFIGATLTREMRNTMILSVAIHAVAVVVLMPVMGNHGLWAALMVLNGVRGLGMALYYPRAEAAATPLA